MYVTLPTFNIYCTYLYQESPEIEAFEKNFPSGVFFNFTTYLFTLFKKFLGPS